MEFWHFREKGVLCSGLRVSDAGFKDFLTAPYAENENENVNTIVLFLLSSGQQVFGAVFLRFLAHMRKYSIEVFGSHHSKFRAGK